MIPRYKIVSFEVAELLQKHGFHMEVDYSYEYRNSDYQVLHENLTPRVECSVEWYGAPSFPIAMFFLHKKYGYCYYEEENHLVVYKLDDFGNLKSVYRTRFSDENRAEAYNDMLKTILTGI